MTDPGYDPRLAPPLTDDDLTEIRQRIHDAARAYQQLDGTLPDPIHMALALDVPHLLGEVERLRALLADPEQDRFPIGGPYCDEDTRAAARAVGELVRYLNHASRHPEAASEPYTVDTVLSAVTGATAGLPQLLGQLAHRLTEFGDRPGLYATGPDPAKTVLALCAFELGAASVGLAQDVAVCLGRAAEWSSKLGVDDPADDGKDA